MHLIKNRISILTLFLFSLAYKSNAQNKSDINFELVKMNVVYFGVDNPIHITSKSSSKALNIVLSEGLLIEKIESD